MSAPVLFSVQICPQGGFIVIDAARREHRAADDAALGALIARLTNDPSMPKLRVEKRNDVVGIMAGLARRFVPRHAQLVDAAEPMAHHLTELVSASPRLRRPKPQHPSSVEGK